VSVGARRSRSEIVRKAANTKSLEDEYSKKRKTNIIPLKIFNSLKIIKTNPNNRTIMRPGSSQENNECDG
jgi:hypothetical protein